MALRFGVDRYFAQHFGQHEKSTSAVYNLAVFSNFEETWTPAEVSVGVLNAGDISFDPPLPQPMQEALKSMSLV